MSKEVQGLSLHYDPLFEEALAFHPYCLMLDIRKAKCLFHESKWLPQLLSDYGLCCPWPLL